MKYLVTGGAGFIGSHLVEALVDEGIDIRVLDDFSTGKRENIQKLPIEVMEGDVRDASCVEAAMKDITHVFHLAALGSVIRSVQDPLTTHSVNETGTLIVLEASRKAGVKRVVFASSSSIYGNSPTLPKEETFSPAPASPYAISKLMGEYYCNVYRETHGLETVCLRYFNVFGPRQSPDSEYAAVIPRFIDAILNRHAPTIYGNGEQSRDFTFVANTVAATIAAATSQNAVGQVMNVACGERRSLLDLVDELGRVMGRRIIPDFARPRAGDVRHSQAAIGKACKLLDYQPVRSFSDGLGETVEWFRQVHDERYDEAERTRPALSQ